MLNSFVIVIIKNMFYTVVNTSHQLRYHFFIVEIILESVNLIHVKIKQKSIITMMEIRFSLKQLDFYKRNKYQKMQAEQKEGYSSNALYGTRKIAPGRLLLTLTLTITLTQGRSLLGDGGNFKGDNFLFTSLYCKKLRLKTTSNAIFNMKAVLHES